MAPSQRCHDARDRRHVPPFGDFSVGWAWRRMRRCGMALAALRQILFLATALSLPMFAVAGSPPVDPDPMRVCSELTEDAARLSCYDNVMINQLQGSQVTDDEALPGDEPLDNKKKGDGLLGDRWELRKESKRGVFLIRPYKPVYLAPFSWARKRNSAPSTPNPNTTVTQPMDLDDVETDFQLSMKFKVVEGMFGKNFDLWCAYTQSSRWQSYNKRDSRPFRETDYEPEILLVTATNYDVLGWRGRLLGIGLTHQSNGRSEPFSRSWNRAILFAGFERENWAITMRAWRCIDGPHGKSDNPDISDYIGRFEVTAVRVLSDHQFSIMARHSMKAGDRSRGAAQFEWAFPFHAPLRGRLRVFHGYGESLIDYNFKTTLVSLGISLVEWF